MIKCFLSIFFIILSTTLLAADVVVFYPTMVPSKIRASVIKKIGIKDTVYVFTKFKDFENKLKSNGNFIVVTLPIYLNNRDEYIVKGSLKYKGETRYKYYLVRLKENRKKINSVGVVLFTERKKIAREVKSILNLKIKKVRYVSKVEDLFPLLVFNSVDSVLVNQFNFYKLKKRYKTKVAIIKKSNSFKNASVFIHKNILGKENDTILKLLKLELMF